MEQDVEAPQSSVTPASCEVAATKPPMFLGLPRKLAALLLAMASLSLLLADSVIWYGSVVGCLGVVWFAVKEQVSRDLWGFDIFCGWMVTDARFLDMGGDDGWGGPKLCALPLDENLPRGVFGRAAR